MKFYNDILQKSWEITKRQKVLLWFGFFVLLWGGKGVEFENYFANAKLLGNDLSPFQPRFWELSQWGQALDPFFQVQAPIFVLAAIFVVISLFVIAIIIVSQIGLVDGFSKLIDAPKTKKGYSLEKAVRASEKNFWSVLAVNLVSKGLIYGLLFLSATPLFLMSDRSEQVVYTFFLFTILSPFAILISLLTKYAVNYVVLRDLKIGDSFSAAWNLFAKNIGVSIEMAALMFAAFLGINLFSVVLAAILTLPVLLFGLFTGLYLQVTIGLLIYHYFFYLVTVVIMVITAIMFSTWHYGNWTLLFLELTKGRKRSKIHRTWKK